MSTTSARKQLQSLASHPDMPRTAIQTFLEANPVAVPSGASQIRFAIGRASVAPPTDAEATAAAEASAARRAIQAQHAERPDVAFEAKATLRALANNPSMADIIAAIPAAYR